MSNSKNIILLAAAVALAAFAALGVGRFELSYAQILAHFKEAISGEQPSEPQSYAVLMLIRLPRVLFAVLVGAVLASSGAVYQGLFRNPLVSPDILGVSSGAAVGASIAIILNFNYIGVQLSAFGFGLAAVFAVVFISGVIAKGRINLLVMVLTGIVISSLFGAVSSLMKFLADSEDKLPEITFWLMGSLARTGGYQNLAVLLTVVAISLVPLFMLRYKLNALSFGEEEARAIGLNVKVYNIIIIAASTLLTATCVSFCGIVGWIGLVIPHIVRFAVGANFTTLLPASMLSGALFLLIVDTAARSIMASEIPLGVITSLIGAPVFVYLLYKSKRGFS